MTAPRRDRLRVVDAGDVGAFSSQSLWHAIAEETSPDSPATLSFCRPAEPYVGIGYHRRLDELDLDACRRRGLPVIRRRIGGGPVYLDADQLFFQITLPAERAPARVDRLYEQLLAPAVAAFAALGLPAELAGANDIAAAGRKISGTGAGRIGGGVTVVGNVLFRFPHERMAEVLRFPRESLRAECLRLMRRHVSSLAAEGLGGVTEEEAKEALTAAYARALGLDPAPDSIHDNERRAMRRWEERFANPDWLAGPPAPRRPAGADRRIDCRVKIAAGVWLYAAGDGEHAVEASIAHGRIERLAVQVPGVNGRATALGRALAGERADAATLRRHLEGLGDGGSRLAELLEPGLNSP